VGTWFPDNFIKADYPIACRAQSLVNYRSIIIHELILDYFYHNSSHILYFMTYSVSNMPD